jgi:hypothetical protein
MPCKREMMAFPYHASPYHGYYPPSLLTRDSAPAKLPYLNISGFLPFQKTLPVSGFLATR